MSERLAIRCKVSPGMFSSERIIQFTIRSLDFAFFVEHDSVRETGDGRGLLLVDVFWGGPSPIAVVPDAARTRIGVEVADLVEA